MYVGPLGLYKGGLGPKWNFMAVTLPECLPERLGLLSYASEFSFLHDGIRFARLPLNCTVSLILAEMSRTLHLVKLLVA